MVLETDLEPLYEFVVNWCRQAGKERLMTRSITDLRKATETICKDKDSEHPELAFEVSIRSLENEHWTCRFICKSRLLFSWTFVDILIEDDYSF